MGRRERDSLHVVTRERGLGSTEGADERRDFALTVMVVSFVFGVVGTVCILFLSALKLLGMILVVFGILGAVRAVAIGLGRSTPKGPGGRG
jgi:type IV secretory pathway TrbL component